MTRPLCRILLLPVFSVLSLCLLTTPAMATEFRIGIMQAQKGAAEKFGPLEAYLQDHGIEVQFVETPSYSEAARMFGEGELDGMFSGSGVAGSMIIKQVAYPVARPVSRDGHSTYWAVILAPQGAPAFTGQGDYFTGKKVAFCALASSGQFFFRAVPGAVAASTQQLQAPSHGAAIKMLSEGKADVAIVKNWVWEGLKGQYPQLQQVGSDPEQNPDGTLIISQKADSEKVRTVTKILLGVQGDPSPKAQAVRDGLGIQGYIITSAADFSHTLKLLEKAGVGSDFNFSF